MKTLFVSAIFLVLLLNIAPALSQNDDVDEKYQLPQIDVVDVEEGVDGSGDSSDGAEPTKPTETLSDDGTRDSEKQEPSETIKSREIPAEIEKAPEEPVTQLTVEEPSTNQKEPSEPAQENNNNVKQSQTIQDADPKETPEPVTQVKEEPPKNLETQHTTQEPPKQKQNNVSPQQTQQQSTNQPGSQGSEQRNRPTPQGQAQNNPQGPHGQQGRPGQQNQQNQQRQPQQQQQQQPSQTPPPRQNPTPTPPPQQQQQQAPQNNQDQKVGGHESNQPEHGRNSHEPIPTNNQRNIEIGRQGDSARPKTQDTGRKEIYNEQDYLKLRGENSSDYLNHYKVYSEAFFNYIEGLFREAVLPLYHQIRSNQYLSMGFSALVALYIIIFVTRLLGGIFKRQPKFRYNKEETISQSDINNNFKKFLTELDNIKKQMSTTSSTKGNDVGGHSVGNATIPQSLQDNISHIAHGLSKNEDVLNKFIKDKTKLDNFLMEFQKEVVESHKAIWNELYQLRKVFSQGKLNASISSGVKPRQEPRDTDETKSLSSNPEISEAKKREEPRPVTANKLGGEPRSKSVTPNEPANLRPKVIPPKEKRPTEVEAERRPSFPRQVNGQESATRIQKEEEPQPKATTPNVEKGSAQSPFPFAKQNKEEEEQPGIQIPTNLTDKAPSQNPFAQSNVPNANQLNSGTNIPLVGSGQKPGPFGNPLRGKPGVIKPGVPGVLNQPSSNPNLNVPNTNTIPENSKPESTAERRKSSLKTDPFQSANNHVQNPVEQPSEKIVEETKTNFETEATTTGTEIEKLGQEDTQITGEDGDSESTNTSKQFIPPNRGFAPPNTGPGFKPGPGIPGKPGAIIPGNKTLPIPQVRKTGPPGAAVFRGPPGNLPKTGGPTQIKQPSGPILDGTSKNNTQV